MSENDVKALKIKALKDALNELFKLQGIYLDINGCTSERLHRGILELTTRIKEVC